MYASEFFMKSILLARLCQIYTILNFTTMVLSRIQRKIDAGGKNLIYSNWFSFFVYLLFNLLLKNILFLYIPISRNHTLIM